MSYACSDSCENMNCITREQVLAKCSGKPYFSEYLWFQSDALEFSMCQMLGQTCGTRWWKKKRGLRGRIPRKNSKQWAWLQRGGSSSFTGFESNSPSVVEKVADPTPKIQSSAKLWKVLKWQAEIPDTPLRLTGTGDWLSDITSYMWLVLTDVFAHI